jgi:cytidine deaminase
MIAARVAMNYVDLTESDRAVLQQAIDASDRLYISGVQEVGAAVRTATGLIFAAIHFETATGFANVCGEVAAICCMVAAGHRDIEIAAAVWRDPEGQHFLLPPCGRCREVISDFNPGAWVIVPSSEDHWDAAAIERPVKVRVAELLPRRSHQLRVP